MTKYVIVNGLMKAVPDEAKSSQVTEKTTLSDKALTTPYNFDDANEAAKAAGTQLAPRTQETIREVQNPAYTSQFGDYAGNLVDLISQIFTEVRIPIALASKLIRLKNFRIHIKIDDSGSMMSLTNNGKTRWQNAYDRLVLMMKLLQVVPTGTVKISFLDRLSTKTIKRRRRGGMTPQQFYQEAVDYLTRQFQTPASAGTPIYDNVASMLNHARQKPTADFLLTDGLPSGWEDPREEIEATKNLILNRRNAKYNPFTFLCCSDSPNDTMWMHEIEEISCRPGTLGYVAAVQNYRAECVEVLNDQGPWFPYSEPVWLVCNLAAALNPFDLDALDQHEPLTKPTLDNTFLGYISTDVAYEGYFVQHPNATWVFKEDYELFKTTEFAYMIDSVRDFTTVLADKLNADIASGMTNTEFQALAFTEQQIMGRRGRTRPDDLWRNRQNFLVYHCLNMEQQQLNVAIQSNRILQQHIWGDYIFGANLSRTWQKYLDDFHVQYRQAAPPAYQEHPPGADGFSPPAYQHAIASAPVAYSSNYATMYQPQRSMGGIQSQLSASQFPALRTQPLTIVQQSFLPEEGLPADFERRSNCTIS